MVMPIELKDHSDFLMKHWQFEDVALELGSVLLTAFCSRQSIGHEPAIIYRNTSVSRIHEFWELSSYPNDAEYMEEPQVQRYSQIPMFLNRC